MDNLVPRLGMLSRELSSASKGSGSYLLSDSMLKS